MKLIILLILKVDKCTLTHSNVFFFKKNGPTPASLLFIFSLLKQTLQFLQQLYVKNVHPVYFAGIRTHDLWNVSLFPVPITTRPGLPPNLLVFINQFFYIREMGFVNFY